jgi:hypothetical protein
LCRGLNLSADVAFSPARSHFLRALPEFFCDWADQSERIQTLKEIVRGTEQFRMAEAERKLPIYIFSGSDDPVGQRLEGVRLLIDRYRSAGA